MKYQKLLLGGAIGSLALVGAPAFAADNGSIPNCEIEDGVATVVALTDSAGGTVTNPVPCELIGEVNELRFVGSVDYVNQLMNAYRNPASAQFGGAYISSNSVLNWSTASPFSVANLTAISANFPANIVTTNITPTAEMNIVGYPTTALPTGFSVVATEGVVLHVDAGDFEDVLAGLAFDGNAVVVVGAGDQDDLADGNYKLEFDDGELARVRVADGTSIVDAFEFFDEIVTATGVTPVLSESGDSIAESFYMAVDDEGELEIFLEDDMTAEEAQAIAEALGLDGGKLIGSDFYVTLDDAEIHENTDGGEDGGEDGNVDLPETGAMTRGLDGATADMLVAVGAVAVVVAVSMIAKKVRNVRR